MLYCKCMYMIQKHNIHTIRAQLHTSCFSWFDVYIQCNYITIIGAHPYGTIWS